MVLTKEAFLNHLYGGMDEPEMKIIDVFICKLRKKLALAGAENLIGTVWGRGYMIREPLEDVAEPLPIEPVRLTLRPVAA
jgi:two-component system cell cycle response regulator CtrA